MMFICFFIIALLCVSYISVFSKRTDIKIELVKVKGNAEVLKDISIKGDIMDNVHKISFSIHGGEINKSFEYGSFGMISRFGNEPTMENFEPNEMDTFGPWRTMHIGEAKYIIKADGIYKIAQKNEKDNTFEPLSPPQKVFPIDLQKSKAEILHGNFIGDNIVVILSREDSVFAIVFDTVENKQLSEIRISENKLETWYDSAVSNNFLVLKQTERIEYGEYMHFYVIDILNNKVVETVNIKNEYSTYRLYTKVLYKNDTLFILYDYYDTHLTAARQYIKPMLKIFAYKNGKRLYEGEVVTDIKFDDYYDEQIYSNYTRKYFNTRME